MIIVSQDKEKIVNLDNLTQVYITTEERAKEVLQEITRQYENLMWKLGKTILSFQDEFVYRTPED